MREREREREVRDMSKNFTTGYIWNPFFRNLTELTESELKM